MIKVGLIDKNELFRESLNFLIDYKTDMETQFSSNCVDQLKTNLKPGMLNVLLVDIAGLNESDKSILKEVIHHFPEVKVIVLSDSISQKLVSEFLKFRIYGYYSKSITDKQLEEIIKESLVCNNSIQVQLGSKVKDVLIKEQYFNVETLAESDFFSLRESQIIKLICREKSNAEIADILGVSIRTIESHRRRMISRTESKTIIGVLLYALRNSPEAMGIVE